MKARLSYSLTELDYWPVCQIEVFGDSSDDASMIEMAIGKTFAEARKKAIKRVYDAFLNRKVSSLEIPPSEEIEL